MKAGRALDTDIAIKIMNQHPVDITKILHYSTDIYDAYKIVYRFQINNWNCSVNSKIGADGNLLYKVLFHKRNIRCEKSALTIAMAICLTAMAVIDGKYVEYENDTINSGEVNISKKILKTNIEKIEYTEEIVLDILKNIIKEHTDKKNLPKKIIDILMKNGYSITKNTTNIS